MKDAKETIPRVARRDYKPFWSDKLQVLEDDLNEARDKAEKDPIHQSTIGLQQAKARFLKAKLDAIRKSWREKTSSLNL